MPVRVSAQLDKWRAVSTTEVPHQSGEVLAVQTGSALLAGCTSATLTNGLDVVKTRLQVRIIVSYSARPHRCSANHESQHSSIGSETLFIAQIKC